MSLTNKYTTHGFTISTFLSFTLCSVVVHIELFYKLLLFYKFLPRPHKTAQCRESPRLSLACHQRFFVIVCW